MGATTTLLSFEEFEHLPDAPGKRELLDGELIELPPPKRRHTIIQHRIAEALRRYAVEHGLLVFVEAGFHLGARRSEWLKPDVYWKMAERSISNPGSSGEVKTSCSITGLSVQALVPPDTAGFSTYIIRSLPNLARLSAGSDR